MIMIQCSKTKVKISYHNFMKSRQVGRQMVPLDSLEIDSKFFLFCVRLRLKVFKSSNKTVSILQQPSRGKKNFFTFA